MGLTAKGYIRRTYDDILNDKIQRAKEFFGEDIDTSDLTPLGKFIRINAYDQAQTEEELEAVYYARFPDTATGQSLDRLLPFVGITRNQAEAVMYDVKLTGTAGYTVPVGFLVGTDMGQEYYTVEDVVIGDDGTCMVAVCCTEPGSMGNVNASVINRIVNPDASVEAVEGLSCLSVGTDEESDVDLRTRFHAAVSGSGSGNANAIRAALLRIPTVQFAAVIENEDDVADAEGRPPHSFECYVLGGDDYQQEIAEAIFEKRPIGIQTTGDKAVMITDASGNTKVVRFSNTQNVRVMVKVRIITDATFAADGVASIQASVANYINGLGIGKSLVLSTIYGHIYKIPGVVEVVGLQLSTDEGGTYGADNVVVPQYGIAVCAGVEVSAE